MGNRRKAHVAGAPTKPSALAAIGAALRRIFARPPEPKPPVPDVDWISRVRRATIQEPGEYVLSTVPAHVYGIFARESGPQEVVIYDQQMPAPGRIRQRVNLQQRERQWIPSTPTIAEGSDGLLVVALGKPFRGACDIYFEPLA